MNAQGTAREGALGRNGKGALTEEQVLVVQAKSGHSSAFGLIACGIAAASLVLIYQLYQPVKIEGNSMTPLLSNDEAIIINKLVYHFEPIRRGDVVVFRYPLDPTKWYIKRIVGLPGETVQIRQGLVYINGSWIPEPYVLSQYEDLSDLGPIQVPSDSYFVLGDHRNSSNDSRVFGTVTRRLIDGRADFAYWPKNHFGSLSTRRTQMNHGVLLRKSSLWSWRNLMASAGLI
jgi:signal peptidase I